MTVPPPIQLGSLGMADTLILMVMALVVFGPRRLPQIGRQIGKLMYEFRKASNDFKFQMEEELRLSEDADRRKKEEERRKQQEAASVAASAAPALPASSSPSDPPAAIASEANPVDEAPRIQPPSTGDIVATSGGSQRAEVTEPSADTPSTANSMTELAVSPVPNPSDSTHETVSHND